MKSITLKWRDTNANIDGIRIYRSKAPIDAANLPAPLATLDPTTTEFVDTSGLESDTDYFYRISAFKGNEEKVGIERRGSTRDNIFVASPQFVMKFNGVGEESWRVEIGVDSTSSTIELKFDPRNNHLWVNASTRLLCLDGDNGAVLKDIPVPSREYETTNFRFELDLWDDVIYVYYVSGNTIGYLPVDVWDMDGNVLHEITGIPTGSAASGVDARSATIAYSPTHLFVGFNRSGTYYGSIVEKGTWDVVDGGYRGVRSQFDREGNLFVRNGTGTIRRYEFDPTSETFNDTNTDQISVSGTIRDFIIGGNFDISIFNSSGNTISRYDRFGNHKFTIEGHNLTESDWGGGNFAVTASGEIFAYSSESIMKFDSNGEKVWEERISRSTGNLHNPCTVIVEPGAAVITKII